MSALDDITDLAQDVYYTINHAENDDTGDDLTTFQNEFIRGFNIWKREYEKEAYWSKLRVDDLELATIADTTTYSFALDSAYRSPVINRDKYVKIIDADGNKLASFKLVDPNQRYNDSPDADDHPDRAAFVGRNIVLSRVPTEAEVGSKLVLDVVKYHPDLTTSDSTAIDLLPDKTLAIYGIAKNETLSDVTKVALSPSFAQKYDDELQNQIKQNTATNEVYDAGRDSYGHINGIW